MNRFAPVDPGLGEVVGLVAAISLVVVVLWLLARQILAVFTATQRMTIGWLLIALCGVTLAFGWLVIGVPALRAVFVADAGLYHDVILELGDRQPSLEGPTRWSDREIFLYVMAIAQAVFGLNGYVSVVVNVLLVGVILLVIVDLTRLLVGTRVATATATLVALLPATAYWSATPLREALVLCLTVLSVNGAVRMVISPSLRAWLLAIAPMVVMVRTREVQVVALFAAIAVAASMFLWDHAPQVARRALRHPAPVVLACGAVLAVTMVLGPQLHRATLVVAQEAQVTTSQLQDDATSATSPRLDRTGPQHPEQLLIRTPRAIARYLWGPRPLEDAPPSMVAEAAPLWLLTPFVLTGGWLAVHRRRREVLILLAAAAPPALIGALTLGNYGIISRMRLSTWLLLLPLAGWAMTALHARWRRSPSVPRNQSSSRSSSAGP